MSFSGFTLPTELTDIIIDLLRDDTTCLRRCSLVCKAWIPPTRRHLFHEISIGPNDDSGKHERLLQLVLSSPDIVQFIRCLLLGGAENGEDMVLRSRAWARIRETQSLHRLLSMLSKVQSLSLTNHLPWNNYSLGFRHSIKSILRLPSFTHLELRHCYFASSHCFTSLICNCSALNRLLLWNIEIGPHRNPFGTDSDECSEDEDAHVGQVDRRYRLNDLRMDWCSPSTIRDWLLGSQSPIDTTSIRILRIIMDSSDYGLYTTVNKLIKSTSHSLREVTLSIGVIVNQGDTGTNLLIMFHIAHCNHFIR